MQVIRPKHLWALCVYLLCSAMSQLHAQGTPQAWVQWTAQQQWAVRAITPQDQCPRVQWQGGSAVMRERAAPATLPTRKRGANPDDVVAMPWRTCELELPPQANGLSVDGVKLATPAAQVQRIVLIGDTGCRMKLADDAFQDCNSAQRWPFAQVARSAAALKPDLVIHVGDLHYRESPCPQVNEGCANSPWGYGLEPWLADVFEPARPLLQAAPWLLVRGNHESCGRAGVGWQRFFDPYPWSEQRSCQSPMDDAAGDFAPPFTFALDANTQLIVFDSSFAGGAALAAEDPVLQRYAQQMGQVNTLVAQKPHSWFLSHHPVLGFAVAQGGAPIAGHAALQAAFARQVPQRLLPTGVDAAMSGHVHLFEGLDFSSDHPLALVLGNAGSAMDRALNPTLAQAAEPAPGAKVRTFVTQAGFGFATLDRQSDGWLLTEWSVDGQAMLKCQLKGSRLDC